MRAPHVVLAGLAVLGACKDREPPRVQARPARSEIRALYALDDRSALAIVYTDEGYTLARLDEHGTTRWQTPLRGDASVKHGILVNGGTAYVRHFDPTSSFVAAIALDTGAVRWDGRLGTATGVDDGGRDVTQVAFDGWLIEALSHDQTTIKGETTILAVDPASGNTLWTYKLKYDSGTAIISNQLLVLHQLSSDDPFVFDRTGFRGRVHELGLGCGWKGAYLMLEARKNGAMLVEVDPNTLAATRVVAGPIAPAKSRASGPWLESCGTYGDKLILNVLDGPDNHAANYIVVVDSGKVGATVVLDGVSLRATSMAGQLTRFVPVVLETPDSRGSRISMLDLEHPAVAWSGALQEDSITLGSLFHTGGRWYLTTQDSVLNVFDGATGELSVAAKVDDHTMEWSFEPEQVGGGVLWLHEGLAMKPQLAVLDAATLAPNLTRDMQITDVTQQQRKQLGR